MIFLVRSQWEQVILTQEGNTITAMLSNGMQQANITETLTDATGVSNRIQEMITLAMMQGFQLIQQS